MNTQVGERIYRISMQRVSLGEVVSNSEIFETVTRDIDLIALYMYDDTQLKEYIQKNEDNNW